MGRLISFSAFDVSFLLIGLYRALPSLPRGWPNRRQRRFVKMRFAGARVLKAQSGGVRGLPVKRISAVFCASERCTARLFMPVPYSLSPNTGWPICAICTRIWCVRPVSKPTFNQAHLVCAIAFQPPIMRHRMARFIEGGILRRRFSCDYWHCAPAPHPPCRRPVAVRPKPKPDKAAACARRGHARRIVLTSPDAPHRFSPPP